MTASVKESSLHYTWVCAMLMDLVHDHFLFPIFPVLHCLLLDHIYRQISTRLVGKKDMSPTTSQFLNALLLVCDLKAGPLSADIALSMSSAQTLTEIFDNSSENK